MERKNPDNQHRRPPKTTTVGEIDGGDAPASASASASDPALWNAFTDNFRRVQTVLDRNRVLINQVNENHRSKQHENMVKNVALIHEINDNISKVASLYSDFSSSFSGALQNQRNAAVVVKDASGDVKSSCDDNDE